MNKWSHALITGVLVLLTPLTQAAPKELDRVIAVVNDGVVLNSEMTAMRQTVTRNAASGDRELPPQDVLEEQMRERLIVEELQLQEAKRLGIQIDDSQLQQAIENIANEQSVSVSALRDKMAAQGISWDQYREQVRRELTIQKRAMHRYAAVLAFCRKKLRRWPISLTNNRCKKCAIDSRISN